MGERRDRIMILGAGPAQVPLIRTAHEMGLETVVATIPGGWPGIGEADIVSYTDITDEAGIARAAREYAVSGVATCCLETGLKALAHACAVLGLPGVSEAAAEISVNKLAMKEAFAAGGVPAPAWRVLRQPADLDGAAEALGFPLVVKAADLQGSNGVYVVRDAQAAREAMEKCLALTKKDFCLAEQFVSGESFCAEAFVQNGDIFFVLPDGNLTVSNPGRPNIPIGHYVPLDRPGQVQARIRAVAEQAIRTCGIDHCAVNFDMGRDARAVFDGRRDEPLPTAVSMLQAPETGVVRAISLPEKLPDYVSGLTVLPRAGDRVRRFENAGDRIGQVLVTGGSAQQCLQRLEDIISRIGIEVQ